MSPGDEAWLMLPPVAGPALLRFHVVATVVPESLDNVEVLVNDVPVTWRRRDDELGFEYEAFVGENALPDGVGRTRVTFRVQSAARPSDIIPGSANTRSLGLALDWVELHKAPESLRLCTASQ